MTFDQLRVFVAVVEQGSIRAAARVLDMAQSGLTQQIKRLETSLGGTLFVRGHSGIALTSEGEALLVRARIILAECERAEQEFSHLRAEHSGVVEMGALSEAFIRLVPGPLQHLRSSYPKITVHVTSGPSSLLLQGIREGRFDFALCQVAERTDMAGLAGTPLAASQPGILCRKGHPLEKARSIRDLIDSQWVKPRGGVGTPSHRLENWFEQCGLGPPNVAVTVEALIDSLHLVSKSDYLFMGPQVVLREVGFDRSMSLIPVAEPIPAADLALVQRTSAPLAPAARIFAAMLISYARMMR